MDTSAPKRTPSSVSTQDSRPRERAVYAAKVANIRTGPSTGHSIARKAAKGDRLIFIEKRGEWYKLSSTSDQVENWIHESVVLTEAEKSYRDSAPLRLESWSWSHGHGYATAEGQVTNVSERSLKNVTAVVTFKARDGTFITSDDALIDYNPLLPGQTSPWKVLTPYNPAMKKAYVEFKTLFGGTIRTYKD
jgi:uncharacterized protein YgiM (DUF1202 family)